MKRPGTIRSWLSRHRVRAWMDLRMIGVAPTYPQQEHQFCKQCWQHSMIKLIYKYIYVYIYTILRIRKQDLSNNLFAGRRVEDGDVAVGGQQRSLCDTCSTSAQSFLQNARMSMKKKGEEG